eukprot:COSAG04_NODE_3445_length_2810_cov_2.149760_1_plen_42_part_10
MTGPDGGIGGGGGGPPIPAGSGAGVAGGFPKSLGISGTGGGI